MKSPNSFGVHYILRYRKADKASIYAKISVNGCAREISMHQVIKVSDWAVAKGLVKPFTPALRQLNFELEEQKARMIACYKATRDAGDLLTADAVKSMYLGYDNAAPKKTMRLLMKEFEKNQHRTLAPGSWKNYATTYKYLDQFLDSAVKSKDILLSKLNHKFLIDFKDYIQNHPTLLGKPATQNGLAKHVERVKRMVVWARERDWISSNPVEAFKTPKKKSNRAALEEGDLKLIEQCEISDLKIAYVRDLFIFACYTGIAYAELMALTDRNFVPSDDGLSWITGFRVKKNTGYLVPLLSAAITILKKYYTVGHPGRIFPYISNQEVNRMLKVICLFCHLPGDLTFHKARHTFATTITLAKGTPLETISEMLGHTKITTTQIYAKMVAEKVKKDMMELEGKLGELK